MMITSFDDEFYCLGVSGNSCPQEEILAAANLVPNLEKEAHTDFTGMERLS